MNRKLMLKTTLATGLVAAFALTGTAYAQDKGSVGVSMPTSPLHAGSRMATAWSRC